MGVVHETRPVALIVHGWNDDPGTGWLHWLGSELEALGYHVVAPHFEQTPPHRFERWEQQLGTAALLLDERSIIVAHSLGCWLTLRLIDGLPKGFHLSAAYFVAGFYDAPQPGAKKYFQPEPDWSQVIQSVGQRVCFYSDDDTVVMPDRTRRLAHKIEAELICVPGQGHFLGSRGMNAFPELLQIISPPSA